MSLYLERPSTFFQLQWLSRVGPDLACLNRLAIFTFKAALMLQRFAANSVNMFNFEVLRSYENYDVVD